MEEFGSCMSQTMAALMQQNIVMASKQMQLWADNVAGRTWQARSSTRAGADTLAPAVAVASEAKVAPKSAEITKDAQKRVISICSKFEEKARA